MQKYLSAYHRVRSYELDSFGHVNNAVFLNYLEYARTEYLLQKGLSFRSFEDWKAFPFVIKAEIKYKAPAKVHDSLEIRGYVSEWKRSSFVLSYLVYNQEDQLEIVAAEMVFAFVNERGKPIPIPTLFRERMSL